MHQSQAFSVTVMMEKGDSGKVEFTLILFPISYNCMGTMCAPQQRRKAQFSASFSANLHELYDYYKTILQFLKVSSLFASPSEQLTLLVNSYLQSPKTFSQENLGLCSVDSVSKVHPLAYGTTAVTQQWLLDGCLRQNRFIQDFPLQLLDFQESYRHYVEFLYMCFKNPQAVIVPNKLADFMWHAHMQDNFRYRADSVKMLGRVLDHYDDMTPEEMLKHERLTEEARKRLLRVPERRGVAMAPGTSTSMSYHQFGFINYGPGYCGGGGQIDQNSHHDHHRHSHHHHRDSHHHHEDKHHHDHHNHHKQDSSSNHHSHHDHHSNNHHDTNNHYDTSNNHYDHSSNNHQDHSSSNNHQDHSSNHHDTGNNHSSCGGGGASSCGGGASSCGGGASSCGGGASSCGGGGSSCGGGGSD